MGMLSLKVSNAGDGSGDVPHVIVDSGGGVVTSPPSLMTNGQRVNAAYNAQGQGMNIASAMKLPYQSYRPNVTAADMLLTPNALTGMSGLNISGGALAASTAYNVSVAAGNIYGVTKGSTAASQNTGAGNNAVRAPIPQIAGAAYYEVFLSTATQPLWVGRITEAQRAAGGARVTAVGTIDAAGAAPAGSVDIMAIGTGLANNVAPFAASTAIVLPGNIINAYGFGNLNLGFEVSVTDLRSLPTLTYGVYVLDDSTGVYLLKTGAGLSLLSGALQQLYQETVTVVSGCAAIQVLIVSMSGQGASVNIVYSLS